MPIVAKSTLKLRMESVMSNPDYAITSRGEQKFLKAALLVQNEPLQKTHNIETLFRQLVASGVEADLSEEDCELLDSIYIPSKYPSGSVLPEFSPDEEIGIQCIEMAERVRKKVQALV